MEWEYEKTRKISLPLFALFCNSFHFSFKDLLVFEIVMALLRYEV